MHAPNRPSALGLLTLTALSLTAFSLVALGLPGCADAPLELSVPAGPVSGTVPLSLSGNYDQLIIEVDGVVLGGGVGPSLSLDWDTRDFSDGLVTVRGQGFAGSDEPVEVSQEVEVDQGEDDASPPVVGFIEPLGGDVLALGEEIIIRVDAVDDVGLASVALYVDGGLLGELPTEGPFEWAWTPTALGDVSLSVEVEDLVGKPASAGILVEVTEDSSISCTLTAPVDGGAVSGEVGIRAAVSAEGGVNAARFYADGVLIAEDLSSPWQVDWDSSGAVGEQVTLRVDGEARSGATCTDSVEVSVEEGSGDGLEVRISQPGEGAVIFGAVAPVRVAAGGGAGVEDVTLWADGLPAGTDPEAPYEFAFDSTAWPDGPLILEAVATELGTGLEVSDEIEVTVANGR